MAIKDEQFLKDLQPFARVTVVPGVTVGDLNFVSAQSVYSTGYVAPTTDNNFAANIDLDLFQAAIGDNGQGLAAGQVMTRAQTNWLDSAGRLPANECFVGIRCLVSVYQHVNADVAVTGVTLPLSNAIPIPDQTAVWDIIKELSWEYQTGDGIIRNVGPLAGYPQAGGVYDSVDPTDAANTAAIGAQNGYPCPTVAKELPIPFMFLPNISTRVKVRSGSPITTPAAANFVVAADQVKLHALAIRMTFQGYKMTMPV